MRDAGGFNLVLLLIRILVLKKRFILLTTLAMTLIAGIVVMVSDSSYKAAGLIKPPKSDNGSPLDALKEASGGAIAGVLGSFIGGSESGEDDCMTILGSTNFAKLVINQFDLANEYKFGRNGKKYYFADILKEFQKQAEFEVTERGALKISMEDKSPEKARVMVEYMIHVLDSVYTSIQRSSTKQKLVYVDQRVSMTEADVKRFEDSLVDFQNRHNLFLPEVQVQAILENATKTELEMETVKEQMDLESALRGKEGSRYQNLAVQRRLLQKSLQAKLQNPSDSNSLVLPVRLVPALATEYFRLERAYKVKLGLYKYLIQQAEALKLDADRNIQVITVLDAPWANEKRVSPKRRIVVEAVFILTLLFTSFLTVLSTLWERQKTESAETRMFVSDIRANIFKL